MNNTKVNCHNVKVVYQYNNISTQYNIVPQKAVILKS